MRILMQRLKMLVDRLGSGPRLMGQLGSGVWFTSVSFFKFLHKHAFYIFERYTI